MAPIVTGERLSGQIPIHQAGNVMGEGVELHEAADTEVAAEGNFVKGRGLHRTMMKPVVEP